MPDEELGPPGQYQQAVLAALDAHLGPAPVDTKAKKLLLARDPTRVVFDDRQFSTLTFLLSALVGSVNRMTDSLHRDSEASSTALSELVAGLNTTVNGGFDKVAEALGKLKPEPPPVQPKGLTFMSRFKLPADTPDFDIELTIEGGADSEGHPTDLSDLDLIVENTNEAAFVGTLTSQTLSDDKNTLTATVRAHVADPSPDMGVVAYKGINRDTGKLVGAGSDEFLIGAGELATVAKITSKVPFTPEPDEPPVEPPAEG